MSARRYARDVPRAVQRAVSVCLELISDEKRRRALTPDVVHDDYVDAGEVPGGLPALQADLGHDSPSATRSVVAQAEHHRLLRRAGWSNGQLGSRLLFVVEQRLISGGGCANCGEPISRTSVVCQRCQPAFRPDRAWRMKAVEMLVAGKTPNAIAIAVSQPLYPARGDSPLTGVVAFLLGELPTLVGQEWRDGYRAVCGAEWSDLTGRVTSRVRQRRHRRKAA